MNEHDTPRALLDRINGLLSCYTHLDGNHPRVTVRENLSFALDTGDDCTYETTYTSADYQL